MADIVEPEEHRARRAALRRLEKSVIDLGVVRFGPSELQKVKIRAVQAEFSSHGKPDLEPCFLEPYPADLLMKPEVGYVATEFPEYDAPVPNNEIDARPIDNARELSRYLGTYLAVYKSRRPDAKDIIAYDSGWGQREAISDYGFGSLWEFNDPEWRVESISHYYVENLPHIKATLIYNIDGDDETLLRGELLLLIRIMRGHMRRSTFIEHDIVPVLLFSMMGPQHVRLAREIGETCLVE